MKSPSYLRLLNRFEFELLRLELLQITSVASSEVALLSFGLTGLVALRVVLGLHRVTFYGGLANNFKLA
jgi:hypothetical protein